MRSPAGARIAGVRAGLVTIVVRDRSRFHNFHLTGPGVNRRTSVAFVGTQTWRVRIRKGATYRFVCDPHAGQMRGSFKGPVAPKEDSHPCNIVKSMLRCLRGEHGRSSLQRLPPARSPRAGLRRTRRRPRSDGRNRGSSTGSRPTRTRSPCSRPAPATSSRGGPRSRRPLASTFKLAVLAAYAREVAAGRLDPGERIPAADVALWHLQGTDDGAHERALAAMSVADGDTLSLDQVVRAMVEFSDNAATDYLLDRLGRRSHPRDGAGCSASTRSVRASLRSPAPC